MQFACIARMVFNSTRTYQKIFVCPFGADEKWTKRVLIREKTWRNFKRLKTKQQGKSAAMLATVCK